jgi:hypothetical protein
MGRGDWEEKRGFAGGPPSAEQWNDTNGGPKGSTHVSMGSKGIARLGVRGRGRSVHSKGQQRQLHSTQGVQRQLEPLKGLTTHARVSSCNIVRAYIPVGISRGRGQSNDLTPTPTVRRVLTALAILLSAIKLIFWEGGKIVCICVISSGICSLLSHERPFELHPLPVTNMSSLDQSRDMPVCGPSAHR